MNNKVIVAVVILILLVGGAFLYFQSQTSTNTQEVSDQSPVMQQIIDNANMMESSPSSGIDSTGSAMMGSEEGVKEIIVEGSNFKFAPNNITVNKGDKVKVVFKNVGGMPHDFVIDELNVATKQITVGNTDTVEFTADKVGTFDFYCSVGKHRENGMEGTLTVK